MKLLLAIFLFSSSLFSQEKISLSSLSWLAGCWRMEEEKTISEECWMSPSGSMMLGTARTIANGKAVFFEFLQIVETDSGIFYIARPKGETPTEFQLVSFQNNEVIFEQPAHDFPQRIIYRLD
ncbi:MAG: hypothetical protein KGZ58_03000, partial [Ignavibacteriales bacterium]|nr:hypothetical protein [Ignavibacteriales bacterium]